MVDRNFTNKALRLTLFLVASLGAIPARAQDTAVERAMVVARERAEAGDAVAQFSLGSFLYYGGRDLPQAVAWLRRAADQQHAAAEFQMGQLYDFGFGVTLDLEQALAWYRRAAEHGSAAGQRLVGDFYRKGRGVAADDAEAVRWYARGAENDDLLAQFQLGQAYFTGTGVARSYSDAYFWFSIAAGQTPLPDNQKAFIEMRNVAAARMSPEDEAEAAQRVAAWRPPKPM